MLQLYAQFSLYIGIHITAPRPSLELYLTQKEAAARSQHRKEAFMRYVSTRGDAPAVTAGQAILQGLAEDGGLYVPETFPAFARPLDDSERNNVF